MEDEVTRRRPTQVRTGPYEAFDRALGSTMFACEYLGSAIQRRDVADAQHTATDAVEAWLAMRAALRRLELVATIASDQRLQVARSATRMYRRALADLLDRAQEQLPAASLCQLLAQLRLSLAIANDELSVRDGNGPREASGEKR